MVNFKRPRAWHGTDLKYSTGSRKVLDLIFDSWFVHPWFVQSKVRLLLASCLLPSIASWVFHTFRHVSDNVENDTLHNESITRIHSSCLPVSVRNIWHD